MEPVPNLRVSFTDYHSWPEDERWEIIDGHPYAMSGASVIHQELLANLGMTLGIHFRGKACKVFFAPLDVRLSEYDVVQPDLMIICDPAQLKKTHVDGPPTLVIEIASPSTVRHDRLRKFRLYAAAGVKEYWMLTPSPPLAEVYLLDGPGYRAHGVYSEKEVLVSPTFPDLKLELSEIFPYVEFEELRESPPPYPVAQRA